MRPKLFEIDLWENIRKRMCEVLVYALILLQEESDLQRDEPNLNRQFYFCIQAANSILYKQGRGVDYLITPEAQNIPSSLHSTKHFRENKRPDFQWGMIDHSESDPKKQAKVFCIECKRLGDPPSRSWILNENYINHGIFRFMDEQHGYGIDQDSGAMVGYLESSDFDVVLNNINLDLQVSQIAPLEFKSDDGIWKSTECNQLEHSFERPFSISPFSLQHFWIDLRSKFELASKA